VDVGLPVELGVELGAEQDPPRGVVQPQVLECAVRVDQVEESDERDERGKNASSELYAICCGRPCSRPS